MLFLSIVHHYLSWHYTTAFKEIFHVWLNFLWFIVNFFSLPQLMKSWLSPWKRITTERGNTWNLEDLAGFVIINLLSRIVGGILRSTVILSGIIALLMTAAAGFAVYVFWLVAPFVIIGLMGFGISLIIL